MQNSVSNRESKGHEKPDRLVISNMYPNIIRFASKKFQLLIQFSHSVNFIKKLSVDYI